jgi:hypothetical protein
MSNFPQPVVINDKLYFSRDDVEVYKASLLGLPPPSPGEILKLVSAVDVAAELGVGRRTIYRRLREAKAPKGKRPLTEAARRPANVLRPAK